MFRSTANRMNTLLVMMGGAVGAAARFHMGGVIGRGTVLPWGTLAVNILGGLLMGLLVARGTSENVRLLLGRCGITARLQWEPSAQRPSSRHSEERRFGEGRVEERRERAAREAGANRRHASLLTACADLGKEPSAGGRGGFSFAQPINA